MKSKYLCPVCWKELAFGVRDNQSIIIACPNKHCESSAIGLGETEHLAYQKLVESVEKKD